MEEEISKLVSKKMTEREQEDVIAATFSNESVLPALMVRMSRMEEQGLLDDGFVFVCLC